MTFLLPHPAPMLNFVNLPKWQTITAWKVPKYGLFSGPYFPLFGLNNGDLLGKSIQSKDRKIRTTQNSVFGHFSLRMFAKRRNYTLPIKWSYSELFWSAFSRIPAEYGEIRCVSPYSVWLQENADQNHLKYR